MVGVYKGGKTLIKGYGTVDQSASQAPDAETVFQIGSVTKLFTALLLQRLCDEGVVSLDATLGELLGGSMPLSPSVEAVTLRQLVTHTSGFPRVPKSLMDQATARAGDDDPMLDPYSYLGPEYVFDYLADPDGKRKAGRFDYSNYGMGLLAHLLERVTGQDYETLLTEKVFLPLGMDNTAIALTSAMTRQLAQGYTPKGSPTPLWTFAALGGAGAISANAEDMMTFIEASVAESGMASTLFTVMSKPQITGKIGIGWLYPTFIDRFVGNKTVVWHNGMVGGYASYLAIDKRSDVGVVVLTNQASPPDMLGMMLMRLARTQSWASVTPADPSTPPTANASDQ